MNSPTWSNMFVNFTAVYTTSQNGSSYSLDASGDIYYYDSSSASWNWMNGPSTNPLVSISASVDGSLTAVDNTNTSYLYSYGLWSTVSSSAISISTGDADHYVLINSTGSITKYTYGNGSTVSASGGPSSRLSTTANFSQICGVDGTGTVYQRTGTQWATISGKTLKQVDVSISSSNSVQICGVDASGNGWLYNGSTWISITKPSGVTKFLSLEAGAGFIWATSSTNAVFCGTF